MLQFRGRYGAPRGIVHVGDWVCLVETGRLFGIGSDIYRPSRVCLSGPAAGRRVSGRSAYGPRRKKHTPLFELGGKLWRDTSPDVVVTRPGPRCRVLGQSVQSGTPVAAADRSLGWFVEVSFETFPAPLPSRCFLGPAGGLCFDRAGWACDSRTGRAGYRYGRIGLGPGTYNLGGRGPLVCRVFGSSLFAALDTGLTVYPHDKFPDVGPRVAALPLHADPQFQPYITDFDFSPDGQLLAVAVSRTDRHPAFEGCWCGSELQLFRRNSDDLDFGLVRVYDFPATLVSFSPDGLTLAMLGDAREEAAYTTLTLIDVDP